MSKSSEQAVQDRVAEHYEALRYNLPYAQHYHHWWLGQMYALADPQKWSGRILDNGCGVGTLYEFAPESASSIIGLDLSGEMLRRANRYSQQLVQGNSQQLPFVDATFDLIFARSLLHHLPEPVIGVQEMYRILKPGGQIVLADTNKSIISDNPRRIAYRRDNFSGDHANLQFSDYLGWLEQFFTVERVQFFGYLAYPFGFPDMLGPLSRVKYPVALVKALIQVDHWIATIPRIRRQSWGVMVVARKPV